MPSDPDQLTTLPTTGKVPLRDLPDSIKVPRGLPPHLIIRFDRFITDADQERLRKRWDDVLASGAKHQSGKHSNHSANDTAFHFGIWEVTASEPYLTAETQSQTPKAITAIDALLRYIGDFIAGKIASVFETHAPEQWEFMQKAYLRVQTILAAELLTRPSLDFGGAFFAVAVKEGGSGLVHIDWHDCHAIWAFVFAVGDWEGGEFCTPQLGIKIPIRPGQVFAVLARVVAHCSAPVTQGRRIVFACFTDNLTVLHANPGLKFTVVA
ncbi:hypothetical protein EV702DRAFT_965198 [Suillus placidus]|uniref:Uncharacterized protein n=1 Tax=Suillus placidus TaxID=48579 RepID=A0A9P7A184_9AGAM|nr:hypothetical protein EV702DRAFT_965198 [Suillus placidus]